MEQRKLDRAVYALNEALRLISDLPFHSPKVPRNHAIRVSHRKQNQRFTFGTAPGQPPTRHRVNAEFIDVEPQHEAEFLQLVEKIEWLNAALIEYISKASPETE